MAKIISKPFAASLNFDNASVPNWQVKSHKERKEEFNTKYKMRQNSLKFTADKFISDSNDFQKNMRDVEDLPRLQILQNHTRVMRIMRDHYVKANELEKRFENAKGKHHDIEYQKHQEDMISNKQMSSILKGLSATRTKRKPPSIQR